MSKVLGRIGWRDRGEFTAGMKLIEGDMVTYGRSKIVVTEDHTTGETPDMTKMKYLVDQTGVEEALTHAETAATAAETNAAEAATQAEAAKTAGYKEAE